MAAEVKPSALAFPDNDQWVFTKGLPLGGLEVEELDDDLATPPQAAAVLKAFLEDGADFLVRFVAGTLRRFDLADADRDGGGGQ